MLRYDEGACLWQVKTESGEHYSARFVIDTSGVLANPHIPNIKGAQSFNGPKFHAGPGITLSLMKVSESA